MTKIIYEPHPVTPERKTELREKGFKIVDARFDPNPEPKPKRGRPKKIQVEETPVKPVADEVPETSNESEE